MADVSTHGTWTVKPGREDDFARAWRVRTLDEVGLDG
jgi:hypothetical protein